MKCGDESAWRSFHHRYFEFLLGYARSRGANGEDAHDLVQRTYLRILRHIRTMDEFGDLEAWMRCLMRCEVIDLGRSGVRRNALMEKYAHWQQTRRSGDVEPARTADELLSVDVGESLEVDSAPCGVQEQEQRFDVVCHAAGGDPAGEALGNASWFYVCD